MFHVHLGGGPSQHPGARGVHLHPLHPLQTCLQKFLSNTMPIGSMHGKKCLHFTLKKSTIHGSVKKKRPRPMDLSLGWTKKTLYPSWLFHTLRGATRKQKKQSPPYGTDSYVSSVKTASKPCRVGVFYRSMDGWFFSGKCKRIGQYTSPMDPMRTKKNTKKKHLPNPSCAKVSSVFSSPSQEGIWFGQRTTGINIHLGRFCLSQLVSQHLHLQHPAVSSVFFQKTRWGPWGLAISVVNILVDGILMLAQIHLCLIIEWGKTQRLLQFVKGFLFAIGIHKGSMKKHRALTKKH